MTFTGNLIGTNQIWVNGFVGFTLSIYNCSGKQTILKRGLNSEILLLRLALTPMMSQSLM